MILKDKTLQKVTSPMAKAGQKQEQDVAFFLRRAFKDHPNVFVINDFKFTHNNETAQIDHLIIYTYGFILVESKSITGEVKVNEVGEWSRSLGNKWSGMSSPIKQVELQQKLLREMLLENKADILGKVFGIQTGFGGRSWDNLCAVSSNAIIHRETIPKGVSRQLVKTEFLVEKLHKIMRLSLDMIKKVNLFDTRAYFNNEELESVTSFLMAQLKPEILESDKTENITSPATQNISEIKTDSLLECKACGEKSDYSPQYGKYGYFIKCNKCDTNTSMKIPCLSCNSKSTKVSKKNTTYTLSCTDCTSANVLIS
ncbi:nuclease-related domain-containing protein [Colwellia echini]|uniref:NERD domain-containing protein n=1 Tax=Colwellia echini TaxID=1982103 RepID=A0ABY3MZV7_9GAMM|nr:nuclease-related domain-containing protein [Colwellia echini]TYK66671.1 NERD domain-containing protein [Colwellia echini]